MIPTVYDNDNTVRKALNEIQEKLDTLTQIFQLQNRMIVNREETINILKEQIQNQENIIKLLKARKS